MMAVIVGLESLKERCHVRIHSDSTVCGERVIQKGFSLQVESKWLEHE